MKTIDVMIGRSIPEQPDTVLIGLEDVRAAQSLRVIYDYDRDGWVVQRPQVSYEQTGPRSYEEREEWIEVFFSEAWPYGGPEDFLP